MHVDVLTHVTIERPVDVVAAFAADPDNAPRWYVNIHSVEWQTPRPLRAGSRVKFGARFLGRNLSYAYEILEFTPGVRLTMRTAEGPFPMETTYQWRAAGASRTEMSLRNHGDPGRFFGLFAPILAIAMRRANTKDLAQLKALLEQTRVLHGQS